MNYSLRRGAGLLIAITLTIINHSFGQKVSLNKDGLFCYLSEDSASYIKFNFVTQVWVRYTDNNPGTTIQGYPQSNTFDIGLRRARFILSGQISPRTFFFVQFGQNGFSYLSSRKTGAFFHDVTGEYHVFKKELHIGGGLMGWTGPTRFSNSAVGSILALETPAVEEATNDISDQVVRKLGIFAKGTIGKIEYRFSLAKPFIVQTANPPPDAISENSTYSTQPPNVELQSYIRYQFFQNESMTDPGTPGTYLGTKKVLNIGIGANYQKNAMYHMKGTDTSFNDLVLLGIDAFADLPLNPEKGNALTLYLNYNKYLFGDGFLRLGSSMNPANGVDPMYASFNGPGNAYPMIGNGDVVYFQGGYLLKKNLLGKLGTLQPFFDFTYGNYDRLQDPLKLWDLGVNWLVNGKRVKFTFDYQNRPIYYRSGLDKPSITTHKGQWVLQMQFAL